MIFIARQLRHELREQNVDIYMTFVDLAKAFDTVVKIMTKYGFPPIFIAVVWQFPDGMQTHVQNV